MTAIRIFDVRYLFNRNGEVSAGAMETMRDVAAEGKKLPVVRDGRDESAMPKHKLGTEVLEAYDNGEFSMDWSW